METPTNAAQDDDQTQCHTSRRTNTTVLRRENLKGSC